MADLSVAGDTPVRSTFIQSFGQNSFLGRPISVMLCRTPFGDEEHGFDSHGVPKPLNNAEKTKTLTLISLVAISCQGEGCERFLEDPGCDGHTRAGHAGNVVVVVVIGVVVVACPGVNVLDKNFDMPFKVLIFKNAIEVCSIAVLSV